MVDPAQANYELGGSPAHKRMCMALKNGGMGHILDLVVNHMAIVGRQNPWWWDVLENGPSSPYANWFDVDWENPEERWHNKVLLPVLGNHYGRILEHGELNIKHSKGKFSLHYFEHIFPLDPSSLAPVLRNAARSSDSHLLTFLSEEYHSLPHPGAGESEKAQLRHRTQSILFQLLTRLCHENPHISVAIDIEVDRINTDFDALNHLLEQQNYRLAFWRTAKRDLGYRRFFDINSLAALRIEKMEVFNTVHALPFEWAEKGWLDGFRIDHPDGLRDPEEYFQRVQQACPDKWIVAEKILEPGETLCRTWAINGTTGYDFLNLCSGLFIESANEDQFDYIYTTFSNYKISFAKTVYQCRQTVLDNLLASDLNRLASLFVAVCEQHRCYRDYTRHELYETLHETIICYPVYRTYVGYRADRVSKKDAHYIHIAVEKAMQNRPDLDPELFTFLRRLLLLEVKGPLEGELVMRFQQLTDPVMAKGVEDTAFYRYNRLLTLNEVGGSPDRFGICAEQLHTFCNHMQAHYPYSMLNTTTHDTKRSEDVRTRLAVLSEIPQRWSEILHEWSELNDSKHINNMLDRNTEYLLYQTIIGAWPIGTERLWEYMEKAIREAKVHTAWTRINPEYEKTVRKFVFDLMADSTFTAMIDSFVNEILLPGRINSLAQALLKLTIPGVPNIYQGTELWSLSLVDPDNRRLVDFDLRQQLLNKIQKFTPKQIMHSMDEGLPKLWVTQCALRLRHNNPEMFGANADYSPLHATGKRAHNLFSFIRSTEVICVVPRLVSKAYRHKDPAEGIWKQNWWDGTTLELPSGQWEHLLSAEAFSGGPQAVEKLLGVFPVALLVRRGGENDSH
jgi:(1->4)-alpha-D-glucan 1-alpha-D-glucosylmutase